MDPTAIEQRYRNDLEAAETWKDANPERYSEEVNKAAMRRADSYAEMATAAQAETARTTLASARTTALTEFPLADPDAVSGDTAEAIRASAERSHKFTQTQRETAQREALEARRPATRQAWTGNPNATRPGLPGGELRQPESEMQKQNERIYDRTREIIAESRKPGTLRRYSEEAGEVLRAQDPEAQAFADYRALHPNSGLSDQAMRARAEGTVTLVSPPSGVPDNEDRRG